MSQKNKTTTIRLNAGDHTLWTAIAKHQDISLAELMRQGARLRIKMLCHNPTTRQEIEALKEAIDAKEVL